MNKKGIAAGGNLIVDIIKITDSYPKLGNLASVLSIGKSTGGAVSNVLIDLAKIDSTLKLQAVGVIGEDDNGEYVKNRLVENGIDISSVTTHPDLGTSFTDVMSIKDIGERTFFHYRVANAVFGPEHIDFTKLDADILHLAYILLLDKMDEADPEYGTVMARVLAEAQKNGIKTSIDVVSENSDRFSRLVPPSLKYTDLCVINEVEASMTTGIEIRKEDGKLDMSKAEEICSKFFDMGVSEWIVVHSPELGFGMQRDSKELFSEPSADLPKDYIKGKVGAGDAFCAGILYAAYMGLELPRALEIASATAACSLSEADSTSGMMPIDEAMRLYAEFGKSPNP